jgi:hypothetical protein
MFACLSGDTDTIDYANGMIQLHSILLIPAFDWTTTAWYAPRRSVHKLHGVGIEGKQVVAPGVLELCAAIRYTTGVVEVRSDLTGMYRAVKDS